MTAFFVATVKIKDMEKFQEYSKKAGATFAEHGGELVLRGRADGVLAGSSDVQMVGIVKFPDKDAMSAWYNSDAYQAITALRDEAADMTIVTFEAPA